LIFYNLDRIVILGHFNAKVKKNCKKNAFFCGLLLIFL